MFKNYFFPFLISLVFFFLHSPLYGQRLSTFSEDRATFLEELGTMMTAGKIKELEDLYKDFARQFSAGTYSDEDWQRIRSIGNTMLSQRLSANPFFRSYLECLLILKSSAELMPRFNSWHDTFSKLLNDEENRNANKVKDFLDFSISFLPEKILRSSKGGISWIARSSESLLDYKNGQLIVSFNQLNLVGKSGQDSIAIKETSGQYLPFEESWSGKGGMVSWDRVGQKDVFVELGPYDIDMRKSIYRVEESLLTYPEIFPGQEIPGRFEDKVITSGDATTGSFPKFESRDSLLEIDKLGPGIRYIGGFRLEGSTIYGFGSTILKGAIEVFNKQGDLKFRAKAENFVVRRGERLAAQSANIVLYFGQDSIFHPSVNLKFDMQNQELNLFRGQRGSDRNPFFDSYHQVNIDSDKLDWYLARDSIILGKKTLGIGEGKSEVVFESFGFFDESEYRRIQNISSVNPIAKFKNVSDDLEKSSFSASFLAEELNPRFTSKSIQSLLYELVSKGFINYDSDRERIEIKNKIHHYADASEDQVDFDVLRILSTAKRDNNAVLSLKSDNYVINAVDYIEFSPFQKVALKPFGQQMVLKEDRNMDFDGQVFAGFSVMEGKDFHFNYRDFNMRMDSIRYFDLYIPTGEMDKLGNPKAVAVLSRIEHLRGVLLIDAPANKSGREDIEMFPSFNSEGPSYVFYDDASIQGGAYERDSFFFELKPFNLNSLDNYVKGDIRFEGKLQSSEIMPEIEETLVIMGEGENQSLGFITETPEEGLVTYVDRGNYQGQISLSNEGLLGKGKLQYLGSSAESEDIIFKPRQMLASAELFELEEDRVNDPEFPQATGYDVKIDWRPYQDSMYIRSQERPFEIYKDPDYELEGTLILTPGGLKADGVLDWPSGRLRSKLLSFGAFSVSADTAALSIKALDNPDEVAVSNDNVQGAIDFDQQLGRFTANDENSPTDLPYNQYLTTMNTFDWDLAEKRVEFQSDEAKLAQFVSVHPDQDSLYFEGKTASYDLKTSQLNIGGVPFIETCDAFVYPDSGRVDIEPNGVMTTLDNARIVASTINKYHVINRATVNILGRRKYTASGFYEYNIGEKEQEIEFSNIVGQPVGKGSYSEKKTETRATGEVEESDRFYIDHKTEFKGTISLKAESKLLQFEGFARLDVPELPNRQWFSVNSPGDKKNLTIKFDEPKSFEGFIIRNGLFLSKETALSYPRVMMPLFFRKDRAIMDAKGFFRYDKQKDVFLFGDSLKVANPDALSGDLMTYSVSDGTIKAEGKLLIGSKLNYIGVTAAGRAETRFAPPSDTLDLPGVGTDLTMDVMAGINIPLPDKLVEIIQNDLKSSSFDALSVGYQPVDLFVKAVSELFPDMKELDQTIDVLRVEQILNIPKKENNFTFLFSRLPLKWNPDYQSFVSMRDRLGVASVNGDMVNRMLKCFVEFKMPSNEDDRLYIHLESPSGYFYFFGYKQGILSTVSNNVTYNDAIMELKKKERFLKMPDGGFFEIQPADEAKARIFVNRVKAARE
jgi:hypothetical protein